MEVPVVNQDDPPSSQERFFSQGFCFKAIFFCLGKTEMGYYYNKSLSHFILLIDFPLGLPKRAIRISTRNVSLEFEYILGGGNSNIFYFHPYLGKIPNLTNIFSDGLKPPTGIMMNLF